MKSERLIHTGSPQARTLIASVDEDVPPDPVRQQEAILRALDVTPDGASSAASADAKKTRRWWALASVAGLILACAVATSLVARRPALAPRIEGTAPAAPSVAPEREHAAAVTLGPEAPPSVDVHALAPPANGAPPAPEPPRAGRAPARRDGTAATAASLEKDAELALLDRAQTAAARGRGDDALALVALHRRDFPRGRFILEMSVVEIEALARSGRTSEAVAKGERFLESHPGSTYARRIEAVVRSGSPKEQPR